ncbi:hypothetical protein G6L29_31355 [Agrobacterium rhizogenes]|uniref:hypothetical protein n=1 Tax=Rhizobium rhizogenes TaxID=359 RepID=UPI00157390A2|nr:hypothetical protein [Rhizobium rhizogenes]NTG90889.1 hypothetical protein [Rhizobium rhizogenes]NTI20162.1 hypothetical protein [Rhizobium rhizogenes]NTI39210.1 hypothetical protein [Rhizobium rhizogenes]WEO69075.1 hypothetical protein G6L54_022925 [Rhizobium rhizogenes]
MGMLFRGGWLASIEGIFYYAVVGVVFVASAILLYRRRRLGAWIFAAGLATSLFWAFWRAGLDIQNLIPRILTQQIFGTLLLTPWVQRPLTGQWDWIQRLPLKATAFLYVSLHLAAFAGYSLRLALPPEASPNPKIGFEPAKAAYVYTNTTGEDWPVCGGNASLRYPFCQ